MTTHLVAMGGGGFSMADDDKPTALDRFLLDLADVTDPLVCFAPTASADSVDYVRRFTDAFGALGVRTSVLTLWQDAAESVARLAEADVLYVGGGSTVNLVALWNAHGVPAQLRRICDERDMVLAGLSAGANCWYEACTTDAFGPRLEPWIGGLGSVPGSFCPHFDGEPERRPLFTSAVRRGNLPPGFAADDGAAVHHVDGAVAGFLTERPGADVYRVAAEGEVEPMEARQLL
jgi:peptidase E